MVLCYSSLHRLRHLCCLGWSQTLPIFFRAQVGAGVQLELQSSSQMGTIYVCTLSTQTLAHPHGFFQAVSVCLSVWFWVIGCGSHHCLTSNQEHPESIYLLTVQTQGQVPEMRRNSNFPFSESLFPAPQATSSQDGGDFLFLQWMLLSFTHRDVASGYALSRSKTPEHNSITAL